MSKGWARVEQGLSKEEKMGIDAVIMCRPRAGTEGETGDEGRTKFDPLRRPTPYGATHEVISDYYGRYFGPGYRRGYWPTIRRILTWAMERGDVWYLSDACYDANDYMDSPTQEDHDEFGRSHLVTREMLKELDELWAGVGQD